jgi:hypothetical protein
MYDELGELVAEDENTCSSCGQELIGTIVSAWVSDGSRMCQHSFRVTNSGKTYTATSIDFPWARVHGGSLEEAVNGCRRLLGHTGKDAQIPEEETLIPTTEEAELIDFYNKQNALPTLSDDQLRQALLNVGVDLECGACAGQFYTGSSMVEHTCEQKDRQTVTITQ